MTDRHGQRFFVTAALLVGGGLAFAILLGTWPRIALASSDQDETNRTTPVLATLALRAGAPGSVLIAGPGADEAARAALTAGTTRARSLTTSRILRRPDPYPISRLQESGEPASTLGEEAMPTPSSRYDQVQLLIPRRLESAAREGDIAESYLYTLETFQVLWKQLRDGGTFVILARDETLFMRAALMAWEMLKQDPAGGSNLLVRQAWAFRLDSSRPHEPFHYMVVLVKGPVSVETAARIQKAADDARAQISADRSGLIGLFGPDIIPKSSFNIADAPFNIFYHPGGITIARKALSELVGWKAKLPPDLAVSTFDRPFFYQVVRELYPPLRWYLGICLGLLAAVLLLPRPDERRASNPAAGDRPPIAVLLGYFALSGGVLSFSVTALFHQASGFIGEPVMVSGVVAVAAIAGVGLALLIHRRLSVRLSQRVSWYATGLIAVSTFVLVALAASHGAPAVVDWPSAARMALAATLAFAGALLPTLLATRVLEFLSRRLAVLVPWAWISSGLGISVGPVIALWTAQFWGWSTAWLVATGCYAALFVILAWLDLFARAAARRATGTSQEAQVGA